MHYKLIDDASSYISFETDILSWFCAIDALV